MSGIRRYKIGEMSTDSKGEKYVEELNNALSPESLASCDPSEDESV